MPVSEQSSVNRTVRIGYVGGYEPVVPTRLIAHSHATKGEQEHTYVLEGEPQRSSVDDAKVARIRELEADVERLRGMLNNGWLVVNDPANSFLAAEPWSTRVESEIGAIQGCMRAARRNAR
jgi:hypothetical protein